MGLPARFLTPGEREVMTVRTHWKTLVTPVVLLLAVVAVTSFCAALVPDGQYQRWARVAIGAAGLVLVLRLTVWPFLVWATTSFTLTDLRLANRSGVLRRVGRDIPLHRISDVAYERSLSDRVFGCGTLVVGTANDSGETLIDDIPRVAEFHLAMTSLLLERDRRHTGRRDRGYRGDDGGYRDDAAYGDDGAGAGYRDDAGGYRRDGRYEDDGAYVGDDGYRDDDTDDDGGRDDDAPTVVQPAVRDVRPAPGRDEPTRVDVVVPGSDRGRRRRR